MPFVLTAEPRHGPDRGAGGSDPGGPALERTDGDGLQELLATADDVVPVVLDLVRSGGWSVGVGVGEVQPPLPDRARAATGPAVLAARLAVVAATGSPDRLAVRGSRAEEAADAQAVLRALALLVRRRSAAAWEAIALVAAGRSQAQAAAELGVSRQAVGQRLAAAAWDLERELRITAARLLERAAG